MTTMTAVAAAERAVHGAHAAGQERVAKNILLFFAAPFIGLAYIVAFPFVGFYAFASVLARK